MARGGRLPDSGQVLGGYRRPMCGNVSRSHRPRHAFPHRRSGAELLVALDQPEGHGHHYGGALEPAWRDVLTIAAPVGGGGR